MQAVDQEWVALARIIHDETQKPQAVMWFLHMLNRAGQMTVMKMSLY